MSSSENTVIGPSILINGKLTGDEDLTVRGRVEGELALSRTLIVEPSGIVKANVAVKNAIISGVVVGNITATESVELTHEGRMVGDIRAPRVIIVDGASFRGRVDMGEASNRGEGEARPAATRPGLVRPAVRAAIPVRAPVKPAIPAAPVRSASAVPAPAAPANRGAAPQPPAPPVMADAGKKKVLLKKLKK